jgi:carboxyl-terminal processing protease
MTRRNLTVLMVLACVSWLCYQRASRNRFAATLTHAMNVVTARYINEVEPRVLFEGAMDGMIDKLDPYSAYASPEEYNDFQQQMEGEISGIGIIVDSDAESGYLTVQEALVGKPAYLAGIRAGDKIVAIEGKDAKEMPRREAVKLIRGQAGTRVKIRVQHMGREQADHELERAAIPVESVLGDARGKDGKWVFRLASHPRVGYMRIINFGDRTADEFREALATYRRPDEQIEGFILDLRYNPGGSLTAATAVCDALLEKGLIVTTRGRNDMIMEQHSATPGVELPLEVPMVVLVDQLSASASEIVAACLQDHRRAAIAGQRTWGKGTVQHVISLEGGRSALRLTIGSYRRPSGQDIHKWKKSKDTDEWGVRPDAGLEVALTNHQNDVIHAARRKRDSMPWEGVQAAHHPGAESVITEPTAGPPGGESAETPPTPVPEPDADDSAPTTIRAAQAEGAAAAKRDPALVDPQLRKALEYLQQEISKRTDSPPQA